MLNHPILHKAYLVTSQARYVTINEKAIDEFTLEQDNPECHWLEACPEPYADFFFSQPLYLKFLVLGVFHSIGFCYFPRPRWKKDIEGTTYDGAIALWLSLMQEWPQLLKHLTSGGAQHQNALQELLHGSNSLPFLKERNEHLRIWCNLSKEISKSESLVAKILALPETHKSQSVTAAAADCTISALGLALHLERTLPSFRDRAILSWISQKENEIIFAKRAQLLVNDWHYLLKAEGRHGFTHSEKLTGFADYKIPQQLRELGLISYKVPLDRFVDRQLYLTSNEQMEVEIRAVTITVIDLLSKKLKIQATKLDNLLWMESQKLSSGTRRPYHRTLSLGY